MMGFELNIGLLIALAVVVVVIANAGRILPGYGRCQYLVCLPPPFMKKSIACPTGNILTTYTLLVKNKLNPHILKKVTPWLLE